MMLQPVAEEALRQGVGALPFDVTNAQLEKFRAYLSLLQRWNGIHNLTAIRDQREQVILHLLDCLAVMPYLPQVEQLADIGSGAGLPAVVVAIMRPQTTVFAVESSHKKAAFIRQVAAVLGLDNLQVINERVEKWQPDSAMDLVISRAMAAPEMLLSLTAHLGKRKTSWVMMCGHPPSLSAIDGFYLHEQIPVSVPLLDATRTLLIMVGEDEND